MKIARKSIDKITITCPSCGYEQLEYAEASASACHSCGTYIPLKNDKKRNKVRRFRPTRHTIRCLECKHPQDVPSDTISWQCMHCGAYIDFTVHRVDTSQKAKITTYSGIIIGPKGHFWGSRAEADWMEIAGFSAGMLIAWSHITINGHARLRGKTTTQILEIDPEGFLDADQIVECQTAIIHGQVNAKHLIVGGELRVGPTGQVKAEAFQFSSLSVALGGSLYGRGTAVIKPAFSPVLTSPLEVVEDPSQKKEELHEDRLTQGE